MDKKFIYKTNIIILIALCLLTDKYYTKDKKYESVSNESCKAKSVIYLDVDLLPSNKAFTSMKQSKIVRSKKPEYIQVD